MASYERSVDSPVRVDLSNSSSVVSVGPYGLGGCPSDKCTFGNGLKLRPCAFNDWVDLGDRVTMRVFAPSSVLNYGTTETLVRVLPNKSCTCASGWVEVGVCP